ncbi:ATP-binding cassette domain-containing protein [Mycolicibacterium flavescens]|uniref:ABC transporter n=1 Tax=Mycolicibacterium flavescens TaxID=1776 RepID=A0A1E3RHD5_MYCFV|nr:ATP-binding cassette domain-containing protein [Mycolicibacterium flavescens]MCV7282853.1 ATP-binding cassette domain-containing protein [Mycolicibacterium flavescens]ODQ88827.1 ABC transporter [Mycolicibacterium flavescens]
MEATGVAARFGEHRVFSGVNVTAATGAVTGITGPSGCGKTTLLRVLAGLHRPAAGEIRYDGAAAAPRGSLALLAQHPRLVCNPRWTLRRIVAEPAAIRGTQADIGDAVERVGLTAALLDRHPGQVSDGQLQRACLARMLVQRASYVLCDEPTAMLDPIATGDVVDVLREVGGTAAVVLVSHDAALVEALSDEVLPLSAAAVGH